MIKRKCTDEMIAAMKAEYASGISVSDIAKKYNLGITTVKYWVYPKTGKRIRYTWDEQEAKRVSRQAAVDRLIKLMTVGSKLNLHYKSNEFRNETRAQDKQIQVHTGEVIQITDTQIIVRDINRQYIKAGISFRDLLSGWIKVDIIDSLGCSKKVVNSA